MACLFVCFFVFENRVGSLIHRINPVYITLFDMKAKINNINSIDVVV
tara:strand:- start:959 stop:1099 length:141 start_codon:yes stop_codon:yes gene_type:complete